VDVGGQPATNVVFNSDSSLTATLPAQSAGADNIVVTTPIGSSAITPADQFTYLSAVQSQSVTCQTSNCPIPIVQFPDTEGDSTSVSSTVSSGCSACTFTSEVTTGLPTPCTDSSGCCPDGMSYTQAQISVGESDDTSPVDVLTSTVVEGQAAYANGTPFPPPPVPDTTVCAEAQALATGGSSANALGTGPNASPAKKKLGQDILLTKCAKPAVAPCVKKQKVSGRNVVTTVIVPVNESVTLTVGPQEETFKKVSPDSGAPGSNLTIKGTNLSEVNAVTIGGVEASIVSETAKKLIVTVPPGASTGRITLVGWSGDVKSPTAFTVT
jgi:IPT/TIG domain-containing protein